MEWRSDSEREAEDTIIVEATLTLLRKAAKRALFEYHETLETKEGQQSLIIGEVKMGESVLFEEDIQSCPAQLTATRLIGDMWLMISTGAPPDSGYPTTRDAVKAGKAEAKKLRIVKEFLTGVDGAKVVEDVHNWQPHLRAEANEVLGIIDTARKRWCH